MSRKQSQTFFPVSLFFLASFFAMKMSLPRRSFRLLCTQSHLSLTASCCLVGCLTDYYIKSAYMLYMAATTFFFFPHSHTYYMGKERESKHTYKKVQNVRSTREQYLLLLQVYDGGDERTLVQITHPALVGLECVVVVVVDVVVDVVVALAIASQVFVSTLLSKLLLLLLLSKNTPPLPSTSKQEQQQIQY